jgi:hypothetical protein
MKLSNFIKLSTFKLQINFFDKTDMQVYLNT